MLRHGHCSSRLTVSTVFTHHNISDSMFPVEALYYYSALPHHLPDYLALVSLFDCWKQCNHIQIYQCMVEFLLSNPFSRFCTIILSCCSNPHSVQIHACTSILIILVISSASCWQAQGGTSSSKEFPGTGPSFSMFFSTPDSSLLSPSFWQARGGPFPPRYFHKLAPHFLFHSQL